MIQLGSKVRDRVTGFEGVVVVRSEYLNKCIRCGVQGLELKDGLPSDAVYFDEEQLEVIEPDYCRGAEKSQAGGNRPDAPSSPVSPR